MRVLSCPWPFHLALTLAILVVINTGTARPESSRVVTAEFTDAHLGSALREVANSAGVVLYSDHYLAHTVTLTFKDTPLDIALTQCLVNSPFHSWTVRRTHDNKVGLYVDSPLSGEIYRDLEDPDAGLSGFEVEFKQCRAESVLESLQRDFPKCKFTKIANFEILKVEGQSKNVLEVKQALSDSGSLRMLGMPEPRQLLPVRLSNVSSTQEKLELAFPELEFKLLPDHKLLVATGPPREIREARKLLLKLDVPR